MSQSSTATGRHMPCQVSSVMRVITATPATSRAPAAPLQPPTNPGRWPLPRSRLRLATAGPGLARVSQGAGTPRAQVSSPPTPCTAMAGTQPIAVCKYHNSVMHNIVMSFYINHSSCSHAHTFCLAAGMNRFRVARHAAGALGSPASDRHTEDSSQNAAPAASEEERRSGDSSGNATAVQHGVGQTGESSEAVPVSMRSSKPAGRQHQQQQLHRTTSSLSEQGLNSAAGNAKSHLPGASLKLLLWLLHSLYAELVPSVGFQAIELLS